MKTFPAAADLKIVDPFLQKPPTPGRATWVWSSIGSLPRRVACVSWSMSRISTTGRRQARVVKVEPIDPFGYTRSGANGYPKKMTTTYHGPPLVVQCHIWPGKSHLDGFKLDGEGGPDAHQGFYFYRNDRLLRPADGTRSSPVIGSISSHALAIDIDDSWSGRFRMNPEKSSVATDADFQDAIVKRGLRTGRPSGHSLMTLVRYTSGRGSGVRTGPRWFRREKASTAHCGARSTMSSNTCRTRILRHSMEAYSMGRPSWKSIASEGRSG